MSGFAPMDNALLIKEAEYGEQHLADALSGTALLNKMRSIHDLTNHIFVEFGKVFEEIPGGFVGCLATFIDLLALTGYYGDHFYQQAMGVKLQLHACFNELYRDEKHLKRIINFYEKEESLRIDANDAFSLLSYRFLMKVVAKSASAGATLVEQEARVLKTILTVILKCSRNILKRLGIKQSQDVNQTAAKLVKQLRPSFTKLMRVASIASFVPSAYGNACLAIVDGLNSPDQVVGMMLVGEPDFKPFNLFIEPADYGPETEARVMQFQYVRDFNDTAIPRIFTYQ